MANQKINGGASPYPKHVGPAPICSFSDGAQDAPLKSLKFYIEPSQDLHGYSYPWPAGGGKNKLDTSSFSSTSYGGVTYTRQSDGGIKINGTINTAASIYILNNISLTLAAGTYTLSGTGKSEIYAYLLPGYRGGTFTLTEETTFTALQVRQETVGYNANFTWYPQLESGSTATAYAPYSNICPITGWTQVDAVAAGYNVWDEEWELGSYDNSGAPVANNTIIRTKNYIGVKPSKEYWIRSPINGVLYWYDASKTFISLESFNSNGQLKAAPANAVYLRFRLASTYGTTYNNDISINYPSSDHAYHAYQGTPITIALGQTVYGGTVDALNGKLVIDRAMVDLGALYWTTYSSPEMHVFRAAYPTPRPFIDSNSLLPHAICSSYYPMAYLPISSNDNGAFSLGNERVLVIDHRFSDVASFSAEVNGVKLVYELATPQEYDLTPVSVSSLLGQNNVWCNTGETELDYYPAQSSVVAVWDRTRHMYVSIPLSAIRYDTYQINPQQAIDLDSYRSETGTLIRNVVGSKAKIEFNTPMMDDSQWSEVWSILSAGFNNTNEKKLKLKYYDTQSGSYKYGYFYVPDVQTPIRSIDEPNGIINYNEIRIAFIEY